jgi:hypothetical protein
MKLIYAAPLALLIGCSEDGSSVTGTNPDTAPIASVDRFADNFGTLFKRSAPVFDPAHVQPVVPAPNAPIDFDALFTVRSLGPAGEPSTYYSFDILPRVPATAYELRHDGEPIAGQLPIIDRLPGADGYNDFVLITEVAVGEDYVANTFTSFADVDAAVAAGEATLTATSRIANRPAVPAGSTATKKFIAQPVTGARSWLDGSVVHQMRFEENLAVTEDGTVPVAEIIVMFANNTDPSQGFSTNPDGSTRNAIDTLADDPGYSSLWNHSVGNNANFASVVDYATAFANVMAADVGVDVNCPEVR